MPVQQKYDWESIQKDYQTGLFSNYALAEKYGVSEGAIRKRAKQHEWQKDLVDDYQKGVQNQLIQESTQAEYATRTFKSNKELQDDRAVVDQAVKIGVEVVRNHRKQITKLHGIFNDLSERLRTAIDEELDGGERLPSLVGFKSQHESVFDILSKLSGIGSNLIKLERQAFNLDSKETAQTLDGSIDDRIQKRMEKLKNADR